MVISAFYTETFSILKTTMSTSSGKISKTLSTVSTGNKGRFEPMSGDAPEGFIGKNKTATHRLFTKQNTTIDTGVIIQDSNSVQYDVIHVGKYNYFASEHHLEIILEERSKNIS